MSTRLYLRARLRLAGRDSPQRQEVLRADGIEAPSAEHNGKRILFATSIGGHPLAPEIDSLVAMSMWLRGADPYFLLCDGFLLDERRPSTSRPRQVCATRSVAEGVLAIRDNGITRDVASRDQYTQLLELPVMERRVTRRRSSAPTVTPITTSAAA